MLGVLRFDDDGLPICELCGKSFKKLGQHVYNSHNMTAYEYKKMFGLDTRKGLISKKSKDRLRQNVYNNYDKCIKDNLIEKGKSTRFKLGDEGRTLDKISVQTMNMLKARTNFGINKKKENDNETLIK